MSTALLNRSESLPSCEPVSPDTAAWRALPRKEVEQRRKKAQQAMAESRWVRAHAQLTPLVDDPKAASTDLEAYALVLQRLGRYDHSWQIAKRLLEADPGSFKAARLGTAALIQQNRWSEAIELFDRHGNGPGRLDYSFVADHGAALAALGRPQQAVQVLLEAMMLDCSDPGLHMRLAHVLCDMKMFEESAESWLTALKLDPGRLIARLMLLHMRQRACQWASYGADCEELIAALADGTGTAIAQSEGGSFSLLSIEHPATLLKKVTQAVAMRKPAGFAPFPERPLLLPAGRRIRVGYVSNDFYCHATALLMVEMLEQRNQQRFEVTLYSHSPSDGTSIEARIRAACEHFVDIGAMSDRDAAERIRSDEIDILVDLKGQTAGNRLALFAWRPAPLQVTFLGFPGTSGADYIDYVIGDRWVTPLHHADRYSEQIAQMPGCYQPNDSQRELPEPLKRSQFLLPEDKLVLGCFNQSYKITPATFDVWTDILKAVPNSVLWLLEDNAQATANLRREAEARGVAADRLLFAPKLPVAFHLARLPLADLMLDNWPYNAHTTASDALWMGVPMVSLEGEGFASRVGGSLLRSVGLDELVCKSVDEYRETVVALLRDPVRLQSLRNRLADGRRTFGLFDGARFAEDIEMLYERMLERAQAGLPPCALDATVSPSATDSLALRGSGEKPPALNSMRVAVITPYFKESRAWIERCIQSVRKQSFACEHFLVADGHAQDWIEGEEVRHLRLDRSHADYGATRHSGPSLPSLKATTQWPFSMPIIGTNQNMWRPA